MGNVRVALVVSILFLWIHLRFAARNIELVDGESFFKKAFTHQGDAGSMVNVDIRPRMLIFAIDAAIVFLSLIIAVSVSSQWDISCASDTAARLAPRIRSLASTWVSKFSVFHSMSCCREP